MSLNNFLTRSCLNSISALNHIRPINTVAVLMYHNISDDIPPSYRSIKVNDFREQMRYLKKKCEVIDIRKLIEIYRSPQTMSKSRKPRVVITIDDGHYDNYTNAFPILKEFGLPATLFIVSNWSMNEAEGPKRAFLNLREMKEMTNHGITFCSHTQSHRNLSKLGYEEQRKEILSGMKRLYDLFPGKEVLEAFAYPFGEYNHFTLEILENLKFKVGLTVWHHLNGPFENPLRLKRLTVDGQESIIKFAGQLNPYILELYWRYSIRDQKQKLQSKIPDPHTNSFVFEI